jgi:hypothetical protein
MIIIVFESEAVVASLKLRNIITHYIKVASHIVIVIYREGQWRYNKIDYFHGDLFMKDTDKKEWKYLIVEREIINNGFIYFDKVLVKMRLKLAFKG